MGVPWRSLSVPRRASRMMRSVRLARASAAQRRPWTGCTWAARATSASSPSSIRTWTVGMRPAGISIVSVPSGWAGQEAERPPIGPRSDGLACEQLAERAAAAGAHRLTRRAHAGPAPLPERVLDDAVLSRVIGDHPEAPAWHQGVAQRWQRALQLAQLVVDRHPERLKQACELGRPGTRS